MTDTKKIAKTPPNASLIWVLLIVLSLAIAGWVYFFADDKGNKLSAGSCDASVELAGQLEGSIGGDMAAFLISERPQSLLDISFLDSDGEPKTLGDFAGKTLLVNLWATWCAPCRAEMPSLQRLEVDMGGADFSVVPISVDLGSVDKPKQFYEEMELQKLAFYHDGTMAVFNEFKKRTLAVGLPATVLLDKTGCVLGRLNGPAEWGGVDAKRLISAAIALK